MGKTVRLVGPRQREHAKALIDQAPDGWTVSIGEETRTQEQNRKLWACLRDIRDQVMPEFAPDDIKLRFLHALGKEMRFLPELEGAGHFPVGQSSRTLSKSQFAGLLELILAYGAREGVQWRDDARNVFAEYGISG